MKNHPLFFLILFIFVMIGGFALLAKKVEEEHAQHMVESCENSITFNGAHLRVARFYERQKRASCSEEFLTQGWHVVDYRTGDWESVYQR